MDELTTNGEPLKFCGVVVSIPEPSISQYQSDLQYHPTLGLILIKVKG